MIPVTALQRETTTQTVRHWLADLYTGSTQAKRPSHQWAVAGVEPSLGDMLRDPMVLLVMARDAINAEDVALAIVQAKAQLMEAAV